ncbi:MAG: endolytic transglycosylase MltG [Christensenellales bacterium]
MAKDNNNYIDDIGSNTRTFSLNGSANEPLEKCEERESLKEMPAGIMAWRVTRPLLILLASVFLVAALGVFVYNYIEQNYLLPVSGDTAVKRIEIRAGSSLSKIAMLLYEEGIIRNKFVFQLYVDLNDMSSSLKAGRYDLSPSMTMEQIAAILKEGDGGRKTKTVTFTEGSSVEIIASRLVAAEIFDEQRRGEFLALCNDAEAFSDYDFISKLADEAADGRKYLLEGYLFPDTYEFYIDAEPKDIIRRLLNQFDNVFTVTFEDRAKELGLSVNEAVTLASIVEWEALPKDYKKVSSVFYNRIKDKMRLDSCATLAYVTGERKLQYTAEERGMDSPYNTYKLTGLPIGPVGNPGQKAIEAALYPDDEYIKEGYLYFCNKDPETGELAFAKTLKEHDKNVEKYSPLWNNTNGKD